MGKTINIITLVIVLIISAITLITMFNYPKDFNCYQKECTEYNIDNFSPCKHLGIESVGFMTYEDFYFCKGIKIAKRCLKVEEIKQDIEPNLWDVLTYKCSKLEDAPEQQGDKE